MYQKCMTRRHGGRGRRVRRHSKWLFGIVERVSNNSYYKVVRRRDAATLLMLILRHVWPNTIVDTDEWRSYRALARFPGFRHRFVNHGVNFVDPQDRTLHTQTIEGKNGQWKEWVRRRHGIEDHILPRPLYLKEKNALYTFFEQILWLRSLEGRR